MKNKYILLIMIVLITLCGCSKQENNPEQTTTSATNSKSIVLEENNKYLKIDNIDFSECDLENENFSCDIYYNQHTTEEYENEYSEYYYRRIYFEFLDEKGNVVADESTFNNYIKKGDYTSQESFHVSIQSKYKIKEIIIKKIELLIE